METIQLGVDEVIPKKFGEEMIKEYLTRMISIKRMEFFTGKISDSIRLSEEDYQGELEEIRKESWEEYKKDLPL